MRLSCAPPIVLVSSINEIDSCLQNVERHQQQESRCEDPLIQHSEEEEEDDAQVSGLEWRKRRVVLLWSSFPISSHE